MPIVNCSGDLVAIDCLDCPPVPILGKIRSIAFIDLNRHQTDPFQFNVPGDWVQWQNEGSLFILNETKGDLPAGEIQTVTGYGDQKTIAVTTARTLNIQVQFDCSRRPFVNSLFNAKKYGFLLRLSNNNVIAVTDVPVSWTGDMIIPAEPTAAVEFSITGNWDSLFIPQCYTDVPPVAWTCYPQTIPLP